MADHKVLMPFILQWEGRISNFAGDTIAAKNPCYGTYTYTYKGKVKTITNPHTSKGIMWSVFKSLSSDLGYSPDPELFVDMPDWLWLKIYKEKYWDFYQLDSMPFQKIANFMVSWKWGGVSNKEYEHLALKLGKKGIFNGPKTFMSWIIKNKTSIDENKIISAACDVREDFFRYRSNPSAREANLKGWLNRLEAFKKFNSVSSFATGSAGLVVAIFAVGLYIWLK